MLMVFVIFIFVSLFIVVRLLNWNGCGGVFGEVFLVMCGRFIDIGVVLGFLVLEEIGDMMFGL